MIERLLIANRGEIALRVARACRELGIGVVAVYSTADRDSALVAMADEAVHIGPPAPRRSYLNVPALIEAAHRSGADAIHPGYGFLSEDQDFAEICAAEGLTFVGPPPAVMQRVADKSVARALMAEAGLPLLPGGIEPVADAAAGARLADQVGYPVIIKAVAGGGGRGMTVVTDRHAFEAAFVTTQAEARTLFGCPDVYVERFLGGARHVEIQVMCDRFGNGIHLGERDCSIQRRHQKLLEESPCPRLDPDLRGRMGEAAVRGALSVGLTGAGTMEFLLDEAGAFFFMELNARIQVEHPVTEMITGIDLVREQLLIGGGAPLSYRQGDIRFRGAAIECRINAEDPARQFAPTPGTLDRFATPGGPFTRVDTGYRAGDQVSASYDSLLAKVIVWAPDRDQAIARMDRALAEFRIEGPGVATTLGMHRALLANDAFRRTDYNASFLEHRLDELLHPSIPPTPPVPAPPVPSLPGPAPAELAALPVQRATGTTPRPSGADHPHPSTTRTKGIPAMTTPHFTVADLMELLSQKAGLSRDKHTSNPSATLDDVGLDSLAFLALQSGLQERYGFEISGEGPTYGDSVGDIAADIDARLQRTPQPAAR